jgi:undecaprenyl-diphosphatase
VTYVFAALLGLVQGLTEFFPVSSSAHLILARAFFGWEGEAMGLGLAFDVACHVGTLAAVVVYFRRDLLALGAAVPEAVFGRGGVPGHMVRLVVAGTVPIVAVGLVAADWLETMRVPLVCAVALAAGGFGLMVAERVSKGSRRDAELSPVEAVVIGSGQALALLPGVSRSGATITIAMLLGVQRASAARFVFLMSIPAVAGAAGREGLKLGAAGLAGSQAGVFLAGVVVSGLAGYVALTSLVRYLAGHSLDVFAYYRFALAGAAVAWMLA